MGRIEADIALENWPFGFVRLIGCWIPVPVRDRDSLPYLPITGKWFKHLHDMYAMKNAYLLNFRKIIKIKTRSPPIAAAA